MFILVLKFEISAPVLPFELIEQLLRVFITLVIVFVLGRGLVLYAYFDEVKVTGKGNQRVLLFRGGSNWGEFISAGNYLKMRDGNDMLFYYAKCNRTN